MDTQERAELVNVLESLLDVIEAERAFLTAVLTTLENHGIMDPAERPNLDPTVVTIGRLVVELGRAVNENIASDQ